MISESVIIVATQPRNVSARSRLGPRSRLRQAREWQHRLVESWRNSENRADTVDDASRHCSGVPGGRGEAMRLGGALRLVIDDEEEVFRLVGRRDRREGREILGVRIA